MDRGWEAEVEIGGEMIVDDMCELDPRFRRLVDDAVIVQVPFVTCPYDDSDGQAGLLWGNQIDDRLIPSKDTELGRIIDVALLSLPYPKIVMFGEKDYGCQLLIEVKAPDDIPEFFPALRSFVKYHLRDPDDLVSLVPSRQRIFSVLCWEGPDRRVVLEAAGIYIPDINGLAELGSQMIIELLLRRGCDMSSFPFIGSKRPCRHVETGALIVRIAETLYDEFSWIAPGVSFLQFLEHFVKVEERFLQVIRERSFSGQNSSCALASAIGLLNCRNVIKEKKAVPEKIQHARRKRRKLPKLSYYTLRVKFPKERGDVGKADRREESQAIHWVRGHFKWYSEDRPLFGRYSGVFWWQPHLSGRVEERTVEKGYRIEVKNVKSGMEAGYDC